MKTPKYFIDNMVICSKQVGEYLESDFIRFNCVIIDEVVFESRNSKRANKIKKLRKGTDAADLEYLILISQDSIEKYKFLKLYEGTADVMLLASAIAVRDRLTGEQVDLFDEGIEPIIVTEEKALRHACVDYEITWLSQADFIKILNVASASQISLGIS